MFEDIRSAIARVLGSPSRLRYLVRGGPKAAYALARFLKTIVPQAAAALEEIRALAETVPDPLLRREALASIEGKAYHVAGACILATFLPSSAARRYVAIVAPLETIYDYLDNLCDRHPAVAVQAYPVLHQAIADALDPSATPREYYARGPAGDDGGYLQTLVTRCQRGLAQLAEHERLLPYFVTSAELYAEMQTFTHLAPGERELACIAWYERRRRSFAELEWHEFACAAGSQFQIYAPLFALFAGEPDAIGAAYEAYFPFVAALHVLLDSFIDRAEDREHGELNFSALYDGERRLRERAAFLASSALRRFKVLPHPGRHRFVLRTMALFYLTHPKVFAQGLDAQARLLLSATE